MKYALSMYLGGIVVDVTEADYDTAKELGCVCSNCGEAVFLRAGHTRERTLVNGEKYIQTIDPVFSHYRYDGSKDCKIRHLSHEVKQKVEQYKTEGKNQRLALYNRHLWDMFAGFKNIKINDLKIIKKALGNNYYDRNTTRMRAIFRDAGEEVFSVLEAKFVTQTDLEELERKIDSFSFKDISPIDLERKEMALSRLKKIASYFGKGHKHVQLHNDICVEILSFLQTKSSKYFWQNFFYVFFDLHLTNFSKEFQIDPTVGDLKHYKNLLKLQLSKKRKDFVIQTVCTVVLSVHWIDLIEPKIEKRQREKISA